MKTKEIYSKTMKFVWMKLALGAAMILLSIVLLAICMGITLLSKGSLLYVMLVVWVVLTAIANKLVMNYFGYMLKAAHVAVLTTAVTTGQVPDNMFEVGKSMVKERFAASNVYFVLDKLVGGAVRQLQNAVGAVDNLLGNIPGVSAVVSFAKIFIQVALGYVDECCLGYTFLKKDDSAFKAGCDGVVIYFQNGKKLLKDALVTSLVVIGLTVAAMIVPLIVLCLICSALHIHWLIAVILSIMIGAVIRSSFIDSYMLVKTMKSYMEVAPTTEITFDIYGKLCKLSGKFKELFNKSQTAVPAA